jgi:signal transduction histidine kinase
MQDSSVASCTPRVSDRKSALWNIGAIGRRQAGILGIIYASTAAAFWLDVATDFRLAAGLFYVPLVLTAALFKQPRATWTLVAVACALTAAGCFLPLPLTSFSTLVNRVLSIGTILLTGALVSNQQGINARLARAIARADAADIAKSQLLRNASHDFRNSLNAVLGFTELLKEDCQPGQKDAIGAIEQGGRRLLDSVENLIDLTALDEQGPCLSATDLKPLLQEAITKAKIAAVGRSVAIVWDPPFEGIPPVHADQWAVRRILDNLFQNAVKFSPVGERVRARLRPVGDAVVVEIADEGCGIRRETVEQLGAPLLNIEHHARSDSNGLGIGLTLATRLAGLTGATLDLASPPGRGTIACLTLPVAR